MPGFRSGAASLALNVVARRVRRAGLREELQPILDATRTNLLIDGAE